MDTEKENKGCALLALVPFSLNERCVLVIHAEMKSGKQRLHKMNSVI